MSGVRPYGRLHVPAPTGAEAADFDRVAIDERGVPEAVLMENAGRCAAQLAHHLRPRGPVLALVGAGNNGGDALVAARSLAEWGREVRAVRVAERDDDGLLHGWPVDLRVDDDLDDGDWDRLLAGGPLVLDGILGTGARGAPRARQARAIRRLEGAGAFVVAMDVPSGVSAEDGSVPGEAVEADATVAFGWPKLGALLHPGRARVGRLVAVDIGFPPVDEGRFGARVATPAWVRDLRPRREPDTHKNRVGSLLVVAGREGMAGAAVLAARAALRAGAGLVRLASAPENRTVLQAAVPEAVFLELTDPDAVDEALEASRAVAVGPGLGTGDAARAVLERLEQGPPRPTVADADALNLLADGRPSGPGELAASRPLLLTPHPGEMARLSGADRDAVQGDRPGAARRLAAESGAWVLLKGTPSLVASPGGAPLVVADQAGSELAVGGMGDVLTGACGSLLAQGLSPREAAVVALHWTGRAARRAGGGPGLLPTDVVEALPEAVAEEGAGTTELPFPWVTFDQDPAR